MNKIIDEKLKQIEKENNVEIILAAEAGSRAWGFSSSISDYDIRFIYKRTLNDYLSINHKKDSDIINFKDPDLTYDISGHDLKNALRFIYNSNISVLEWINSPIQYISTDLYEELAHLATEYFDPYRAIMHYFSMAQQHYFRFFSNEDKSVPLKKYFYVIKSLLSAQYVLENKHMPPVDIVNLTNVYFTGKIKERFHKLLNMKREGLLLNGPRISILDKYITEHLEQMQNLVPEIKFDPVDNKPIDKLDAFFRRAINLD